MTYTKMIKELQKLMELKGDNFVVFEVIDIWECKNRVREVITIKHIFAEFQNKKGQFYEKYKIAADFRKLIDFIEKGIEKKIRGFYEDSYKAYMDNWQKEHPGEDYKEWCKKESKKKSEEFFRLVAMMGGSLFSY